MINILINQKGKGKGKYEDSMKWKKPKKKDEIPNFHSNQETQIKHFGRKFNYFEHKIQGE